MKRWNAPEISCAFCTQEALNNAVSVLEECYFETPVLGLTRGFFAPGGVYGQCWWSLDYALAVDGAKWLDFSLGTDLVENLAATQCSDGRVKLYGRDNFDHIPNVREDVASLPKYFSTLRDVAVMSGDAQVVQTARNVCEKSLDWWLEKRQDPETKLISALFEETFIPNTASASRVYAPVDTNAEIANACRHTAALEALAGDSARERKFLETAQEIERAMGKYLWDGEDKCFYPYILPLHRSQKTLMASAFTALPLLGESDRHALVARMLDDAQFNWDTNPLTSVAKTDPLFTTVSGPYCGNPSWSGSVWTLTNFAAIRALRLSGCAELSAALAAKTLRCFANNDSEFAHPFTGKGYGVERYAWTAAQWMQILVEELMGISYDPLARTLRVRPNLPPDASDRTFSIRGLSLPGGARADVRYDGNSAVVTL